MKPAATVLSLILLCAATTGHAVLVAGTTGNTTAPADDPGFANIGSCNSAAAIYLGNRWVLTAFHVNGAGASPVVFGATTYSVTGPVTRLTNNGAGGMSAQTDLVLFQINADPGLPSLEIRGSAAASGDDLVMIGNGQNRQAARTFWQVTANPGSGNDVWTETTGAHNVEGFKAGSGATKRWGTNDAEFTNLNLNAGFGDVRSFATLFHDDPSGRPNEAQAMVGDSGGGVFYKDGGQWYLSGVMHAVGTLGNAGGGFDNAPASTATFNNHFTAIADLSFYRSQILAVTVPEPSAAGLLALASAALLRRRRS